MHLPIIRKCVELPTISLGDTTIVPFRRKHVKDQARIEDHDIRRFFFRGEHYSFQERAEHAREVEMLWQAGGPLFQFAILGLASEYIGECQIVHLVDPTMDPGATILLGDVAFAVALGPDARGAGHGRRTIEMLASWATHQGIGKRAIWPTHPDNAASIALAESLGFTVHDSGVYGDPPLEQLRFGASLCNLTTRDVTIKLEPSRGFVY